MTTMAEIRDAIEDGASAEQLRRIPVPASFRAVVVRKDDIGMFDDVPAEHQDLHRSLRIEEIETPELAPDEVYVAVMASSVNYNTVWSGLFHPVPTFRFLADMGRSGGWDARHDQAFHVLGSDAAGVVLKTGSMVQTWGPGDKVVVHPLRVGGEEPRVQDDAMLTVGQRMWGYETNYGGLAELTVVKASQLLSKPSHLSWDEAAVNVCCNATSYRMLISPNGAAMRPGEIVLVWGAAGGLGSYAIQHVLGGGGIPVGVVSSPDKAALVRALGCEKVIDRSAEGYRFWAEPGVPDPAEWRRLGRDIRNLAGGDPRIVFEHIGRETVGASLYVADRGGIVIMCGATTGYDIHFDARHLWMRLKSIRGSHFANYYEAWEANRLIHMGSVVPPLSAVYPLDNVAEAATLVQRNQHVGKLGVLCLASQEGLGIDAPDMREKIGEERLTLFRRT